MIKALTEVSLRSKNFEGRAEAKGLKMKFDDFSFIFLTVIFSKIFSVVIPLSSYLQSKSVDKKQAETLIQSAYYNISSEKQF